MQAFAAGLVAAIRMRNYLTQYLNIGSAKQLHYLIIVSKKDYDPAFWSRH
jgi:hypothetical protein